jgi:hypothetical protein
MSIIEQLTNLGLPSDAQVTLKYSDGTDVFVHNETEVETALSQTDVVSTFCELIATPGLQAKTAYGSDIIEAFRDADYLDEYERDYTFSDYLTETLNNNFYDLDLVEYSTQKYDHKRGFCTLSADVRVKLDNLVEAAPYLGGWSVSVRTPSGTLTLN